MTYCQYVITDIYRPASQIQNPSLILFMPSTSTEGSSSQGKASGGAMPPGMIMGPDGKPCKICTAFRNWKPGTTNYTEPVGSPASGKQTQTNPTSSFAGFAALASGPASVAPNTSTAYNRPDEPPPGCPPDVEQLGRATWTFLHTTAAYYPEKPTPTQRANMLMLLRSLPILYPCTWCAQDFGEDIEKNPPDVSGRVALSKWLCERHNEVNSKLGKEKFDCAKVDERWKDGPPDGSCD